MPAVCLSTDDLPGDEASRSLLAKQPDVAESSPPEEANGVVPRHGRRLRFRGGGISPIGFQPRCAGYHAGVIVTMAHFSCLPEEREHIAGYPQAPER